MTKAKNSTMKNMKSNGILIMQIQLFKTWEFLDFIELSKIKHLDLLIKDHYGKKKAKKNMSVSMGSI